MVAAQKRRVPLTLGKGFDCKQYVEAIKGILKPDKKYPIVTTWSQ